MVAGEVAVVESWKWGAIYSRSFSYPSSFISHFLNNTNTDEHPSSLSVLEKNIFKSTWLSSAASSTVSLHPSDYSPELFVLTVSLSDSLLEEHYISSLHFTWPQVSCLSGFPARGSLAVIASYIDSSGEKQKFALCFSTPSDAESFITSVEDILLNKLPSGSPTVDVISAISSQSEFNPPYRPDISNMMMSPICASSEPISFNYKGQQESQIQTQVVMAESESNVSAFPPRFTSLVSSCAESKRSALAIKHKPELRDHDVKAHIEKYMQDASFLDMVNKVNEVINELGGGYTI